MPSESPDEQRLRELGYRQELARRMSGFSNFALSLAIICILSGGITSFHIGFNSAGGASLGIGWPLVSLFSLCVAATMAQVASAFPTAGGLYHWGCLLGGRACGWVTAWFNLAGLITVLAAINTGTYDFATAAFGWTPAAESAGTVRVIAVSVMTLSQALLNHYGNRWVIRLTDFSGWLILGIASVMPGALLVATPHWDWSRLWTFTNFSGLPESSPVFPKQDSVPWLFCLGFLLPAYTLTGFDASAHTSEETLEATRNVPKGIVRSVAVSAGFGWVMIVALLLAMPDLKAGAAKGFEIVPWILRSALGERFAQSLLGGVVMAQYLCGLAALTSASRMTYAFARDNGLPGSRWLKTVHSGTQSPSAAVWTSALASVALVILLRYETIAAVCAVFLYLSYVLPVAAGAWAHGRTWTRFGPYQLGSAFKPLAAGSCVGGLFLLVIGVQPPNQQALPILLGSVGVLLVTWFGFEKRRFKGPPGGGLQ
jgi:amino acid transporter